MNNKLGQAGTVCMDNTVSLGPRRALNAVVTPEDITHFHLHSWLANDFTSNLKVYSTKVGYEFEGVLLLNKD